MRRRFPDSSCPKCKKVKHVLPQRRLIAIKAITDTRKDGKGWWRIRRNVVRSWGSSSFFFSRKKRERTSRGAMNWESGANGLVVSTDVFLLLVGWCKRERERESRAEGSDSEMVVATKKTVLSKFLPGLLCTFLTYFDEPLEHIFGGRRWLFIPPPLLFLSLFHSFFLSFLLSLMNCLFILAMMIALICLPVGVCCVYLPSLLRFYWAYIC